MTTHCGIFNKTEESSRLQALKLIESESVDIGLLKYPYNPA
jgi:hypothetical protein